MIKLTSDELKTLEHVEKKVCSFFSVDRHLIEQTNKTSQVSMARGYIFYIM